MKKLMKVLIEGVSGEWSVASGGIGLFKFKKFWFMFLKLARTKLDVFQTSKAFTLECYRITKVFPADEKFAMAQQIRRAALSVHLDIAEGCSRKSIAERKRYFEIARGSVIEIDAALDIAIALGYVATEELNVLGNHLITTFKLLSGLIGNESSSTHN